jgi:hypothetical protein
MIVDKRTWPLYLVVATLTALALMVSVSPSSAQAASPYLSDPPSNEEVEESVQSPEGQAHLKEVSKEEMQKLFVRSYLYVVRLQEYIKRLRSGEATSREQYERLLLAKLQLKDDLDKAKRQAGRDAKDAASAIRELKFALQNAQRSNSFAEAGAYQNGYDAGAARCY